MKDYPYVSTGEFAKLCGTSKHTLFYYYDIGLFLPSYIDENGYRYYHVLQYDTFMSIKQFVNLGMSLTDIKQYFQTRSPSKMIALYQQQEKMLSKQIKELIQLKKSIKTQRQNMENIETYQHNYFYEEMEEQYLERSSKVHSLDEKNMTYEFGKLFMNSKHKVCPYVYGMFYEMDDIENNQDEFRFYTQVTTKMKQENIEKKPRSNYICKYHFGGYDTLFHSCKQLIQFVKENHMHLSDKIYCETIVGDWAASSVNEYVIKIMIAIK